jgi:hypothetical protein
MTSPYKLNIKGQVVDCYDVQDAIGFRQAAVAHAFKKMFAMGNRSGGKSYEQDLDECIWSLTRAKEQLNDVRIGALPRTTEDDRRPRTKTTTNSAAARSKDRALREISLGHNRPSPPTEDGLEEAFKYLKELDQFILTHKRHST